MTEEQLESFVVGCWEALSVLASFPPDTVQVVREGVERNRDLSPSKRIEGLRMAARDLLAMLGELSPEQREQIDGALCGRHEITISRVRAALGIDWAKVAEHGLRNEEEYFAAREIRDDPEGHGVYLAPGVLDDLLQRYEDELESNVS